MRSLLLIALLVACRHERVVNPHEPAGRPAQPEVERDVSAAVAPPAVVHATDGTSFDLASVWAKQRVVLVFYMGHWCPHCQKQLGDLNDRLKDFAAVNTTIIAVSSDPTDDAKALRAKLGLGFELYADPELSVIGGWGVADFGAGISRPATFIIEPGGAISYRKVGDKPTDRPSADEILAKLRH